MSTIPEHLGLVPYRARVDRRAFLNLPGWHAGAYVNAYLEDTSGRPLDGDVEPVEFPQISVAVE